MTAGSVLSTSRPTRREAFLNAWGKEQLPGFEWRFTTDGEGHGYF